MKLEFFLNKIEATANQLKRFSPEAILCTGMACIHQAETIAQILQVPIFCTSFPARGSLNSVRGLVVREVGIRASVSIGISPLSPLSIAPPVLVGEVSVLAYADFAIDAFSGSTRPQINLQSCSEMGSFFG
jgi:hypothetical protein